MARKSRSAEPESRRPQQTQASPTIARQQAFQALKRVFQGLSLSVAQTQTLDSLIDSRDRALANELVKGVLRWRWQLEYFLSRLLEKPVKKKDADVQLVLLLALYELMACRTPEYAIINEAVELVRASGNKGAGRKWAAPMVNAVLRRFSRERHQLMASIDNDRVRYSHPDWILQKIKTDWPEEWQQILQANNQRPAFWLRVNMKHCSADRYLQILEENNIEAAKSALAGHALKLSGGVDVLTLPGFADGDVSVQDAGAQLAAELLNADSVPGCRVLDLCAAPGGKACHLLERYTTIDSLHAVEVDADRMKRVNENMRRLKLKAELIVADARDYSNWWNGEMFDRILIDAPCSGSGVIRRHPDIKSLRRESDMEQLQKLQTEILSAAWQMLKSEGELLYVTCSVFKDENQRQIAAFIADHDDAVEIDIDAPWGVACEHGRQLLPGERDADGFYYCRLKKTLLLPGTGTGR